MCCDISIVKDTFYHCVYMIKAAFQQKSLSILDPQGTLLKCIYVIS